MARRGLEVAGQPTRASLQGDGGRATNRCCASTGHPPTLRGRKPGSARQWLYHRYGIAVVSDVSAFVPHPVAVDCRAQPYGTCPRGAGTELATGTETDWPTPTSGMSWRSSGWSQNSSSTMPNFLAWR